MRASIATLSLAGCAAAGTAGAQQQATPAEQLSDPQAAAVEITGHVLEPRAQEPDPEQLARLGLPEGFSIGVFAEGLVNPRMLAVADDGSVYVTRRTVGDVLLLKDTDGDGRADVEEQVATRPEMHGIAIDGSTVYLVTVTDVYRTERNDDGTFGELERIIDDLPDGGQHPNRTIVYGPDDKLYISVGSTCNACGETNPENATILAAEPDGSTRSIHAAGLRNTIGFAFHPESGDLYGMDHGTDWLGDDVQHEELNLIVEGNKYGWPYVYDDGRLYPQDEPPGGVTAEEWAEQSTEPLGLYTPHAAPMQLTFYTADQFPEAYRGDAFVAMRGSWNRNPPSGYEVLRIDFEDGKPVAFEPFVTGFLAEREDGWSHIGRLAGIAQAQDGALLVTDDENGIIYRISYGTETRHAVNRPEGERIDISAAASAEPPRSTPAELAIRILDSDGQLAVESAAFGEGERIPGRYAREQEDISPPLAWDEGPQGTQSYAILLEDPDVADAPPFVHWIAWNIPAHVTELREGVPGSAAVPLPEGMTQGANDAGSLGYTGMKPPLGDPPHEYNFQVFALASPLDLPHGASRAEVLEAMEGKVLAAGTLVGRFQRGAQTAARR